MKSFLLLLSLICCILPGVAQQEFRIHHINVKNGDATLLGIFDAGTQSYTRTILIDGGSAPPQERLLPYLRKILGTAQPKVDYLVLTHYHDDHYNGLLALKDGTLRADSVIDQGGYPIGSVFPAQAALKTGEVKPAAMKVYPGWISTLTKAVQGGYLKGHASSFFHYGTSPKTNLGHQLILGRLNGVPVTLECVAGWGNTLNSTGVESNPSPKRENANNFTLAFVLTYGQFRYFIGGDLGGDRKSPYIDQETPLSTYLSTKYPSSWSWNHVQEKPGHLCGFKANHHGSEHSNSQAFLQGMSPSVSVTSAGSHKSWKLPRPEYLQTLADLVPISVWTTANNQLFSKGLYFTNLFDFEDVPSKTKAEELFINKPGISFDYGNSEPASTSSYMIKVKPEAINQESQFQVYRIDNFGESMVLLSNFLCHKL